MTAKQERFCAEYLKDGNATQAAIRAGYSEKTAASIGSENLTKPEIKSKIAELRKQIEDSLIADAAEILKFYTRILRGEEKEENILLPEGGEPIFIDKVNQKNQIEAAKQLSRLLGMENISVNIDAVRIIDDI